MRREELEELHYITPMTNAPSIVQHGIVSHRRASRLQHSSVAMAEIQDLRARKSVPGGRLIHEYANLYFHARNPMLYKRLDQRRELCVLRIDVTVLDIAGVVVCDGNAASGYTRFAPAPSGLALIDRELTFARDWTHPDPIMYFQRKSAKCAEVLVPDSVAPRFIVGAYVCEDASRVAFEALGSGLPVEVDRDLFFQ